MKARTDIIGRLVADPDEKRTTKDGHSVINFRVAADTYGHTEFYRVTAWRQQADYVDQYLRKGALVNVEGYMKTRSWEDKDGNKRYSTELQAQQVTGLGSSSSDPEQGSEGAPF